MSNLNRPIAHILSSILNVHGAGVNLNIVDKKVNEALVNRNGTDMKDANGDVKANITDMDLPNTAETRPAGL